MSEGRKEIVLWTIVAVLGIIMGAFWVVGALNNVQKISQSVGQIKFPEIKTPEIPSVATPTEPPNQAVEWKIYTNNEGNFQINYPADWQEVSVNINNVWDTVAFCPLIDKSCSGINQVYLVSYKENPSTVNADSHYLGTQNGIYYYLDSFPQTDEVMFNQMISTFKFINK